MLKIGRFNPLPICSISGSNVYVDAGKQGKILLSPLDHDVQTFRLGESIDVFIYHGKDDTLLATTRRPLAQQETSPTSAIRLSASKPKHNVMREDTDCG